MKAACERLVATFVQPPASIEASETHSACLDFAASAAVARIHYTYFCDVGQTSMLWRRVQDNREGTHGAGADFQRSERLGSSA